MPFLFMGFGVGALATKMVRTLLQPFLSKEKRERDRETTSPSPEGSIASADAQDGLAAASGCGVGSAAAAGSSGECTVTAAQDSNKVMYLRGFMDLISEKIEDLEVSDAVAPPPEIPQMIKEEEEGESDDGESWGRRRLSTAPATPEAWDTGALQPAAGGGAYPPPANLKSWIFLFGYAYLAFVLLIVALLSYFSDAIRCFLNSL